MTEYSQFNLRIPYRITSLEKWGMRVHADFQTDSVNFIKQAGFTGVLVNGGSGIGPDMLLPESLALTDAIPELMPLTVTGNRREMHRRCDLLKDAGLDPWLCLWGVPGPDASCESEFADSNRFFDVQTKYEMQAHLRRDPELFGRRDPKVLSWRGNRPLCLSHPTVQQFYRELYSRIIQDYPQIAGVFYFPGDHQAEICDQTCPRCRVSGKDSWQRIVEHINDIYLAMKQHKPDIRLYFTIWNQDHDQGRDNVQRLMQQLEPGIDLCMSMSDNVDQKRRSGNMRFNQPWSNMSRVGSFFQRTAQQAQQSGRSMMALGEFAQSEVWDPVCHNFPLPLKTLEFLKNAQSIESVDAICDFWGHRKPLHSHANLRIFQAYFAPEAPPLEVADDILLSRAACLHYQLPDDSLLVEQAIGCWQALDCAVDDWALTGWAQRLSFAIGRDAARGRLYMPLIPTYLKTASETWEVKRSILQDGRISPADFARYQEQDCKAMCSVAHEFDAMADALKKQGNGAAADLACREARNIELAGQLFASIGRSILAIDAYNQQDRQLLGQTITDEINARQAQLELSAQLGQGAGVNPMFVNQDIQLMRFYLSSDDFPDTPDELFYMTISPYSV
jgi:hypothetical protein